jgi:hypothetical protein
LIVISPSFFQNFWHGYYALISKPIVMPNLLPAVVQPELINENKMTINSFLTQSYGQAKKQFDGGVTLIQEGVSFIKDEFSTLCDKTGDYLNKIVLPVNNFLKDFTEIETEFQQEEMKASGQTIGCNIIPIEVALLSPMEENY